MYETQQWRELLGSILHDPKEKQRIAHELRLNPITISRWISGEATPRPYNLQLLLKTLPRYRASLLEVMPAAWKSTLNSAPPADESLEEISSSFFIRVLTAHSNLPSNVHFYSICDMVLGQMLKHLDPHRLGMEITLALCLPPLKGDKVHSLREAIGRGTPPWSEHSDQQTFLLGSESLAGHVVTAAHAEAIQSREEKRYLFPVHWMPWEESAMACPLMRAGRVAGCLLVSSTQPDYFLPDRQTLVEHYAHLIALALESSEFYDFGRIELYLMPSFDKQQATFATLRQRVNETLSEAQVRQQPLSLMQAEELVWHQIEAELAGLARQ